MSRACASRYTWTCRLHHVCMPPSEYPGMRMPGTELLKYPGTSDMSGMTSSEIPWYAGYVGYVSMSASRVRRICQVCDFFNFLGMSCMVFLELPGHVYTRHTLVCRVSFLPTHPGMLDISGMSPFDLPGYVGYVGYSAPFKNPYPVSSLP